MIIDVTFEVSYEVFVMVLVIRYWVYNCIPLSRLIRL
jgi:hypothetical protein